MVVLLIAFFSMHADMVGVLAIAVRMPNSCIGAADFEHLIAQNRPFSILLPLFYAFSAQSARSQNAIFDSDGVCNTRSY